MDNIDKRIELLHKVQEEMDRRERIQEEADRLHMAGDFQKEGELYAALRDDSILQNLFRQLDEEEEADCYILRDMSGEADSDALYEFVEDEEELEGLMKIFEELLEDVDLETK